MKKQKPKFYVLQKEFSGKIRNYEVLECLFSDILTQSGKIRKTFTVWDSEYKRIPVRTKEQLEKYITSHFRYLYWAKCECEFIAIDWPYRDTIEDSCPVKIDMYRQLEPNIPLITDIVWDYIKEKIK